MGLILTSIVSFGQGTIMSAVNVGSEQGFDEYRQLSPTNVYGNRVVVQRQRWFGAVAGTGGWLPNYRSFYDDTIKLHKFRPAIKNDGSITGNILWIKNNDSGTIASSPVASLTLSYTQITGLNSIAYNGISSSDVTTALGYSPVNPNGLSSQYIAGDGTKVTFPSIPSAQIQSDWLQGNISAADYIKNKPLIPTNTNQLTNGAGFITGISGSDVTTALGFTPYNSTNPAGYITSAAISGKLNISDTAIMLTNYAKSTQLALKVNISDTSSMLSGYARAGQFVKYSDTSSMLSNLLRKSDTTGMLSGYAKYGQVVKYSDTSSMLSNLLRKSDTAAMLSNYARTYSITTLARNAISAGTGISYNSSTGVITNTLAAPTINNNVSRSFNSNYTISGVNNYAIVTYTVTLSCSTPLLAGTASAQVFLEYSTNSGSTWNTISNVQNTQTVALTVSVAISTPQNFNLTGIIPSNANAIRLRSVTSGSGSVTYVTGQEVVF